MTAPLVVLINIVVIVLVVVVVLWGLRTVLATLTVPPQITALVYVLVVLILLLWTVQYLGFGFQHPWLR